MEPALRGILEKVIDDELSDADVRASLMSAKSPDEVIRIVRRGTLGS